MVKLLRKEYHNYMVRSTLKKVRGSLVIIQGMLRHREIVTPHPHFNLEPSYDTINPWMIPH
jgi:hypothetical protein